MDKEMDEEGAGRSAQPQCAERDPVPWISTEQLEDELFKAIMEDYSGSCDDDAYDDSDDCMLEIDDMEDEDEDEQRRGTLRLLSLMRPRLAELLGRPPAEEETD
jgi:hypothetical protein